MRATVSTVLPLLFLSLGTASTVPVTSTAGPLTLTTTVSSTSTTVLTKTLVMASHTSYVRIVQPAVDSASASASVSDVPSSTAASGTVAAHTTTTAAAMTGVHVAPATGLSSAATTSSSIAAADRGIGVQTGSGLALIVALFAAVLV